MGEYIKISFQDLQIAKEFFDNEKHYREFIYMVTEYYQGNLIQSKTKIVAKYFKTYQKTMDFVLNSKQFGKEGVIRKADKQTVKEHTLEGVVKDPSKEPTQLNNNSNNKEKVISNKSKEKEQLRFPFESEEFLNTWKILLSQKKWRNKSITSLQASLKKLSEYPEPVSIKMMENTIAGEWQGLFELKQGFNNGTTNQPSKHDNIRNALAEAERLDREQDLSDTYTD